MQKKQEKDAAGWLSSAVTVLLILAVVLCLYAVIQVLNNGYVNIGGFMFFRVVTGSMEPTISTGSLLLTREVDIHTVRQNDIICFESQSAVIYGSIVTHRVVQVMTGGDGGILLATQGDANPVADAHYVTENNFVGKVIWYMGEDNVLATAVSFLTDKIGFLGCIVFPCLIFSAFVLRNCVNSIKEELRIAKEELEETEVVTADNLLSSMTPQEYADMVAQIRAELLLEMQLQTENLKGEGPVEIHHEVDSEAVE